MAQILKNNVSGVLGLALGASATSMTLLDASSFPTPPEGDFYLLTLIGLNANGQEATWEVVKVVAKSSNTLTVVRAQEGTTATAWPVATTVQLRLTAGSVVTTDVVAAHIGSGGSTHATATTSAAGFMSAADKTKLDGVATNANNYAHPAGDGNLHVPATGTTSSGKVLTAGATAGSLSWETPLALGSSAGTAAGTAAAGTATTAARSDHVHPVQTSVSGNAGTATKLSTARTITLTGAVSGSLVFDGSADVSIDTSLSIDGGTSNPNPETLTYTYTGVLDVPITSLPGTAEMVVASPLGKERAYGILLSSANARLTGVEFPNLEFIGSSFNPGNTAALTSLSLPALTTVGNTFNPYTMAALTSLSLPALTTVGGTFSPYWMAALTSLSLPALITVGGSFNPNSMAALTSLSLPALTTVGGSFNPNSMAALTSLSLPALITVGGSFNPYSMAALTSLSLPALITVGGSFNPYSMAALTSLSLPALTTVGGTFSPYSMAALTSLSLPAVEVIGATLTSGSAIQLNNSTSALTSFTLPTTLKQVGGSAGNVVITSAALNQASVDNILERLAALDGTNGTVEFTNRTVTITGTSSTPSAAGLAAKATLVARGCTVTHN